jgi:hypothetical protein
MTAPACASRRSTRPTSDGRENGIETTAESFSEETLDDKTSSSLLPPITATLIDDEACMDIEFISMQQLLGDPATETADAGTSASVALAASIVSGTTDLFEGDLGDDGELC